MATPLLLAHLTRAQGVRASVARLQSWKFLLGTFLSLLAPMTPYVRKSNHTKDKQAIIATVALLKK